jgi:hypothetical protein
MAQALLATQHPMHLAQQLLPYEQEASSVHIRQDPTQTDE